MRKCDELMNPKSCLNRARDDEWLFVLLGRDVAAAETVIFWAQLRGKLGKNEPADPQIVEARQWAETVLAEQERKRVSPTEYVFKPVPTM